MKTSTRLTALAVGTATLGCLLGATPAIAATPGAPEAPTVSDTAFTPDGTRAVLGVDAMPGSIVTVKDENDTIVGLKRVGGKGHVQVPLTVQPDSELPVSVQQTANGSTSTETDYLVAPAPKFDTLWSGTKGAVLRIDKEYGTVKIYDAKGKMVALRSTNTSDDTIVSVPLTDSSTTFTAVREWFGTTSTPSTFTVEAKGEKLADPTFGAVSGFTGVHRITGQSGALYKLTDASGWTHSGLLQGGSDYSADGVGIERDLAPGKYTLQLDIRGDVSNTIDVTVPTPSS